MHILDLLKTILVDILESESIRRLSNLDDDEVTVSRLEEVVVPLHLDLHLVLHPVDPWHRLPVGWVASQLHLAAQGN